MEGRRYEALFSDEEDSLRSTGGPKRYSVVIKTIPSRELVGSGIAQLNPNTTSLAGKR
jgi:hypothetical protein